MAALRLTRLTTPRLRPTRLAQPSTVRAASSFAANLATRAPDSHKHASAAEVVSEDVVDPNMNGNYPDPSLESALPIKRSKRDPYGPNGEGGWWDPIERRNYGETIHEDNDILGVFSTEEYTHFTPGKGALLMGTFIASVGLLCGVVARYYPDRPSVPRTFPGGLEQELGGPGAVRARMTEDETSPL